MDTELMEQDGVGSRMRFLKPLKWSLVAGGCAVALYGATRKSPWSIGIGAAASLVGALGSQPFGVSRDFHFTCSFAVNCSPGDAFRYWRNFENLPSFMRHLKSVRIVDAGRSEWTARGPLETPVRWISEIGDEIEERRISWRTVESDSGFEIRGVVEFNAAPSNRGTIIEMSVQYSAPAGPLGYLVSTLFGKNPEFTIREDLRRFKAVIEAGEVPTTQGQPHGPRSKLISAVHKIYPQRVDGSAEFPAIRPAELRAS